ncbi:MAG: cold shock domain-containing protein [Holosporaceae bacterium]|nr:cold shock domain-containing protein [Holosporaceae bacterium]
MEEKTTLRVTGRIKWFSQFKGYGFIEAENVSEDIFLHFSAMDKSGINHLGNDDVILCDIVKSDRGYQVDNIVKLLHSNKYEIEEGRPEQVTVIIRWFNTLKGFGFAKLNSGEDVFIHSSLLKRYKMTTIEPGREIEMIIHRTNFGYEAIDLILE